MSKPNDFIIHTVKFKRANPSVDVAKRFGGSNDALNKFGARARARGSYKDDKGAKGAKSGLVFSTSGGGRGQDVGSVGGRRQRLFGN